jgi:hypothetical protein
MSDKTPTPKQCRRHYARCRRAYYRLRKALNDAHHAGVIKYDNKRFAETSPCHSVWESEGRFVQSTEKQLAQAMREEIINETRLK